MIEDEDTMIGEVVSHDTVYMLVLTSTGTDESEAEERYGDP